MVKSSRSASSADARAAPRFHVIPPRPLVGVGLLFLAGAGFGWRLAPSLLPAAAGFACLLIAVAGPQAARRVFFFLAVFLVGWMRTATLASRLSQRHLDQRMERTEEYVRLTGRVKDDPALFRAGSRRAFRIFTVEVDAIQREDWEPARGEVRALLAEFVEPPPRYGDRVEAAGRVRRAESPSDRASLRIHPGSWLVLGRGRSNPLATFAYGARRRAGDILRLGLENRPEIAAVQTAMLLGLREEFPEDLVRAYQWTGTFHVFAISGLHIGIFCVLWIALLQLAGLPRTRWVWVLAPLLAGYVIATGGSPSAVRAAMTMGIYVSASALHRRPDAPSALALTALLNTAADPRQMLLQSFIYSFVVVAALLALMPLLPEASPRGDGGDPYRVQEPGFFTRWARAMWLRTRSVAWMSGVAWLASTPLSALFAGRISPVGLIGNLFLVPAAFAIVFTGSLSLASGALFPWLGEVFNHANGVWILAVNAGARRILDLPGAYLFLPRPSGLAVAAWYSGWASLFFLRGAWRRCMTGLFACILLGIGLRAVSDHALRADLFDFGPVQTALIRRPYRMTAVVDPGPDYLADSLARQLRTAGVNRVDLLALRVPLMDWSGAARRLAEEFDIGEIWAPDTGVRFPAFRAMLQDLEGMGIPVRRLVAGENRILAGGVEADVFHPPAGFSASRAAAFAMALRFAWEDRSILVLGPLEPGVLSSASNAGPDPAAGEWLVAGGAGNPTEWSGLLDLFAPCVVRFLISDYRELGKEWTEPLVVRKIRWSRPGWPDAEAKTGPGISGWTGKAPSRGPRIPVDPEADRIPGE